MNKVEEKLKAGRMKRAEGALFTDESQRKQSAPAATRKESISSGLSLFLWWNQLYITSQSCSPGITYFRHHMKANINYFDFNVCVFILYAIAVQNKFIKQNINKANFLVPPAEAQWQNTISERGEVVCPTCSVVTRKTVPGLKKHMEICQKVRGHLQIKWSLRYVYCFIFLVGKMLLKTLAP